MINNQPINLMLIVIYCFFMVACSTESAPENTDKTAHYTDNSTVKTSAVTIPQSKVTLAIELALSEQDYRLLATSGRSITIPGIAIENVVAVSALCGVKYAPATGDVIKNDQQRMIRKQQLSYMKQYNHKMIQVCNAMNNIVK